MTVHDKPDDLDSDRYSPWQRSVREHMRARRAVMDELATAMDRARVVLADEDVCQLQTRVRYERETARVLAALHDEVAAADGVVRLVIEMPGCLPVDLLHCPEDELDGYETPRSSRANDLDRAWRVHGNRKR